MGTDWGKARLTTHIPPSPVDLSTAQRTKLGDGDALTVARSLQQKLELDYQR